MPKLKKYGIVLIKYAVLIAVTLVTMIPIISVILSSFKTKIEYLTTGRLVPPENWLNFENFVTLFKHGNVLTGLMNTTIIIVLTLVTSTLFATMVAYCITRFEFRGKRLIEKMYLLASFVPGVIVHLIIFKIFANFNLVDNLMSIVILYSGVDVVSLYLYKQYISQIPLSLDEAAMVEGCSYLNIYRKIILPLLKPAITTAAILKVTYIYNDFYTSFLYLPSDDKGVMSTILYRFIGPYSSNWSVIAAGILIVTIPIFIGFLCSQKFIYKGFIDGAVKS